MGREVRMVPPNWAHPIQQGWRDDRLQPMYDKTFDEAAREWREGFLKWEGGERAERLAAGKDDFEFWEWEGEPPTREYYRPWKDEDATWFQLWETVSEGTPVSPPFATRDELANYLASSGDFWDQKRGDKPWGKAAADAFVKSGWAPSMMVVVGQGVVDSKDIPLHFEQTTPVSP
jgi:hypothetical protein